MNWEQLIAKLNGMLMESEFDFALDIFNRTARHLGRPTVHGVWDEILQEEVFFEDEVPE